MNQTTETPSFSPLADEAGFDPIEERLRATVRATIEAMFEEELAEFLGRLRYGRSEGAAKGYRHGHRERQLTGTFGTETISVPRARIEDEAGKVREWRSKALPRYQRLTKKAEALIAAVYLAGTNTRRVKRALFGLADLEKLLRDHAKTDPVCRTLMTMPGVGAVVALTVKAAIDDPERFRSSKDIGPWVGLTPSRAQSGERDIVGEISRAGDVGLRTALYQAATVMLQRGRPNWLRTWALNVAKRRGKKRATVALARRIGVVLHRMWWDDTDFRFAKQEDAAAA